MNKKLKLIAGGALAAASTLAFAVASFAQVTPTTPTMDTDVSAQADATVAGIVAALSAKFLVVLTVGGGILVTIIAVYFLIRHFRKIVHV